MTDRTKGRLRIIALVVVAFLVQATVASDLRVQGVAPDFLLLAAICVGLAGGARQGLAVGFLAGLIADLYLTDTPVGLWALVLCLVGYVVGGLRENVLPEGWVLTPLLAVLASAAGVVGFVGIGVLVGQHQLVVAGRSELIKVVVVEAAWNAALSIPVTLLFSLAARGTAGAAELDRGRPDRLPTR